MEKPVDLHIERRRAFYAEIGEFLVMWNSAEAWLRYLLVGAFEPSQTIDVLTAELNGQGLIHALSSISPTFEVNIQEGIAAVLELYDRIREYRNYYVHGIITIAYRSDNEVFGRAYSISAKKTLRYSEDVISSSDIESSRRYTQALINATVAIIDNVRPQEGSLVHPQVPSPKTLPLPDRIKKTFRYPLIDLRPPLS